MARMPTFEEIRADFERVRAEQRTGHPFRHAASAAPQAPATRPATMKAAAPSKESPMSLATIEDDIRNGVDAVKAEIGRFEQNLPAYVADAKKLAGNPLAQVAIAAGEHLAAGILPPEALAVLAGNAGKLLGDLLSLYNPQGAQQAPAQAQAQPAQAQQAAPAA